MALISRTMSAGLVYFPPVDLRSKVVDRLRSV